MLYKLWINLLILLKILTFIRGYPDGAPERACFIMVPRHTHPHTYRPIFKQHGPSPYNITLSRTTWRSDTAIRVTIGGAPFKGFMLTACEDGHTDWPTGIFYSESPDARPLWCVDRNDAITHNNSNWKSSVTVLWYGPQFSSADHVVFIATVVTNRTTYWTSIKSSMIVQDATQTAAAGGGEAPEGGAQTGMMPGLDAWGYPTTPSWNWGGGGGGRGGGGGGRGGGGSWRGGGDGGFGMFGGGGGRGGGRGGQGGGGENTAGETTTTGWNSNSGGGSNSAWNRWAMNNMGGGGWTTTQAPERSNTWAPSLFGGGRGGGNSNNNNWGSNGGGGGGTGGWGNNRGNNGGGSNPNGGSKTGGWGNGGGNNQSGSGGSEGNNWGNSGNRPPSGSWGNNGSGGGNNWGNNGSGQGGGSGVGGNRGNNRGGGGGGTGMNNWQMRLMRQLLGFKR